MSDTILTVRDLSVQFCSGSRVVNAVEGVSFEVKRGQTLGIVGESGSGKSVTSLAIMGLVPCPPGRITSGEIIFRHWPEGDRAHPSSATQAPTDVNLRQLPAKMMQQYRGGQMSMIFQEPMSSLNPVYTCGYQLIEAIRQHQPISKTEAEDQAIALLQEVKLLPSDAELLAECGWPPQPPLGEPDHSLVAPRVESSQVNGTQANGTSPASGDDQQADSDLGNDRVNGLVKGGRSVFVGTQVEADRYVRRRKQLMLDRYPHELSGGQLQRVMIAMAISCNPTLLIADEPTTALDVTVQAAILNLLRELRDRRGMAMVFITHDLSIIAEIADTVTVMYQGKVVESGSVQQIFADPQHPYTRGLLTCRPRPDQRLKCLPTVADFMAASQGLGNEPTNPTPASPSMDEVFQNPLTVSVSAMKERLEELQQQPPLLSVRNLQVGFPVKGVFGQVERYVMAVNGVSFDVHPGETLGLVGESGCGKSTLASTLLQLIAPMGGKVIFDGHDITQLTARELRSLRKEMQIIFQDPFSSLDPRMSVGKAILEPLKIHKQGGTRRQQRLRVAELMERVGLDPNCIDRYPHEFSGGQRQRICIARALALNPKFIICDESVSALDVSVQAQVLNLLKGLQEEFGLTYIFISHDLSVVKFMSDRIMVMNRGKVEEIGPADDIYDQPQTAYTKELIAAIPKCTLEQIEFRQAERQNALRAS
ncbi:MAG: ABC transporter ATP-binding protein [Leptolyngbyaceae bacterium]|nr:ABC transporter ATP-binding protein [Leptolyngbyaceae bacterium]